jgi:hypothetical protein
MDKNLDILMHNYPLRRVYDDSIFHIAFSLDFSSYKNVFHLNSTIKKITFMPCEVKDKYP